MLKRARTTSVRNLLKHHQYKQQPVKWLFFFLNQTTMSCLVFARKRQGIYELK